MFSSFMLKDGTQFVSPNIIKYPQTTHISIVRAENGIFSEPMKLSTMIVHKRYNFLYFRRRDFALVFNFFLCRSTEITTITQKRTLTVHYFNIILC